MEARGAAGLDGGRDGVQESRESEADGMLAARGGSGAFQTRER